MGGGTLSGGNGGPPRCGGTVAVRSRPRPGPARVRLREGPFHVSCRSTLKGSSQNGLSHGQRLKPPWMSPKCWLLGTLGLCVDFLPVGQGRELSSGRRARRTHRSAGHCSRSLECPFVCKVLVCHQAPRTGLCPGVAVCASACACVCMCTCARALCRVPAGRRHTHMVATHRCVSSPL